MRVIHILTIISLLLTSCINKEKTNTSQQSLQKSIFYGKWKNTNQNEKVPNFNIYINEDNSVKIEQLMPNGEPEITFSQLNIIDEQTATFFYTTNINGEKVSVKLSVFGQNHLKSECFLTDKPELSGILSPPILCFTYEFIKVESNYE